MLFTVTRPDKDGAPGDQVEVVTQVLATGERKTLLTGGADARYVPSGHLIYVVRGVLFAAPFDASHLELKGTPVPVVEGVRRGISPTVAGAAQLDVSAAGEHGVHPRPERCHIWSDQSGRGRPGRRDHAGATRRGYYVHVRASRDGKRLAIGTDDAKEANAWIYDMNGSSAMRRVTIGGHNRFPIWSGDGQRIALQSDREKDAGIFTQRVDGTGPVERLTSAAEGESHIPESWSPDGRHLLFTVLSKGRYSLRMLVLADRTITPLAGIESAEPIGAAFSADGRWIAYAFESCCGGLSLFQSGSVHSAVPEKRCGVSGAAAAARLSPGLGKPNG